MRFDCTASTPAAQSSECNLSVTSAAVICKNSREALCISAIEDDDRFNKQSIDCFKADTSNELRKTSSREFTNTFRNFSII